MSMPQRRPKNPNPRKGEEHYRAKLTQTQVDTIFWAHDDGVSTRELARRYGVSQSCIARILTGRNWRLGEAE